MESIGVTDPWNTPWPTLGQTSSRSAPVPGNRSNRAEGSSRLEAGRGTARRLDPAVVSADRLVGLAFAICVGAASLAGALLSWVAADIGATGRARTGLIALQFVGVVILCYRWPALEFARVSYRVGTQGIEIKRGVIWRHVVTVPLSRIQYTDVSQGPIQRRFGLASLIVHTAGTHQYEVTPRGDPCGGALDS